MADDSRRIATALEPVSTRRERDRIVVTRGLLLCPTIYVQIRPDRPEGFAKIRLIVSSRERYSFGDFALDVAERRLSKGATSLSVPPKTLDVLATLVRRAGHLVTKRELLDEVWPESFVEEGILTVHMSSLRKTLGNGLAGREYIQTVRGSGYRFVAAVTGHRRPDTTRTPAVYEQVGLGRAHLSTASLLDLSESVAAFQAAVAVDPTYAPAHAGLALAYCAQAERRTVPYATAYAEAKAAALRALAMDSNSADAQAALGAVLFFSEWHWKGAERSLVRALELSPQHTEAMLIYARLLEAMGHLEQGLEMNLRALERDPRSALVHVQVAQSYWHQRNFDESIAWAHKALAIERGHLLASEHLTGGYWRKGDFDRMFAESLKHAEAYGAQSGAVEEVRRICAEFTTAYTTGGRRAVVALMLKQASRQPNGGSPIQLAVLYGEAGELDAAFHHLGRAIDSRDPCLVHLAVAPQWDALRGDARFTESLARMGLEAPESRR